MLCISFILPVSVSLATILINYDLSFKYIWSLSSSPDSRVSRNGLVWPLRFIRSSSILVLSISSGVVRFSSSKCSIVYLFSIAITPVLSFTKSIANINTVIYSCAGTLLLILILHVYSGTPSILIIMVWSLLFPNASIDVLLRLIIYYLIN